MLVLLERGCEGMIARPRLALPRIRRLRDIGDELPIVVVMSSEAPCPCGWRR